MEQTTAQTAWAPREVRPGREMEALAPFFYDCTWKGTAYANMQGPGSPEMEASGGARCQWIMDGLWLACDNFQDQCVNGKQILTWKLYMVVGWDEVGGARVSRGARGQQRDVRAATRGDRRADAGHDTPWSAVGCRPAGEHAVRLGCD